jgi:hypothetical protein
MGRRNEWIGKAWIIAPIIGFNRAGSIPALTTKLKTKLYEHTKLLLRICKRMRVVN